MKKLRFYKEFDQRWYVDLPEWQGDKSDLEMVCGADNMLEYMSNFNDSVTLYLSDTYFTNSNELVLISECEYSGADYKLVEFQGIKYDLDVWLCDVTKFVFGIFPKIIYLAKVYES